MWSFRSYLREKCNDPEFLDQYHEQCAICRKTVQIFNAIREQGLSYEEVSRRAGVELEHLQLLEAAERCDLEEVRKIGRCLGLSLSDECTREEWRRLKR